MGHFEVSPTRAQFRATDSGEDFLGTSRVLEVTREETGAILVAGACQHSLGRI